MEPVLAIVAPGQGAQAPGFLSPWLEDPGFAAHLERAAEVTGLDLVHYGTEADAETIRDTQVAQPLLVASGLAAFAQIFSDSGAGSPGILAGHSVGELTAAGLSGAVSTDDALRLVAARGTAMAEAAAVTPTGMTAILGGVRDDILATLDRHGLTPANDNGPGQIVAAGTLEQLAGLADDPPARARLIPLSVAGAFHTSHMSPAVARLRELAATVDTSDPGVAVISNADGEVVRDGREILDRIVDQIARPVRWDLCMERLRELGVTGILELPPAGTLVGIARRALRGVETFALKTPDQLEEARAFCARHAGGTVGD